jgi:hypothetical protein
MATLLTNRARAWVYSGAWVADCPRGCGNVEYLFDLFDARDPTSPRTVRKPQFWCSYCHLLADIEWAADEADIMAVLGRRPIPHNRNWLPAGHEFALRAGLPHGQTVADLEDENTEHGIGGQ